MRRALALSIVVSMMVLATACGPKIASEEDGDASADGSDDPTRTDADASRTDGGTSVGEGPVDTSDSAGQAQGLVLVAVSVVLQPNTPFQYVGDLTIADGMLTLTLQPLSLDVGSTTTPRLYYGDPLLLAATPVDGDGGFSIELGSVVALGPTNPITGSDVTATMALQGRVLEDGRVAICGTVRGQITQPLQFDLTGSTFAATWIDDVAALPVDFALACP